MTSSTGTVVFNDAKLQAIDVVATERLGVGTLDPTSNLHVVGNVHVTGNVNKLNFTDGYTIKRGANVTVFGTTDVIQEITGPHARASPPLRKYPEVAMTSSVQGGYVVTESSYSTYNANYGYGWKAFDSTRSSVSSEFSWQTDAATYASSGNARTGVAAETITENSNTHVGSWVTLETPRKIQVSSVELICPVSIDQYRPNSVVILGSDNNSTWNFLKGDISSTYTNDIRTITINSSVAYKYHMLLVKTIGSVDAGYATTAFLSDIRYYGYEEDPPTGDTSVDTTITSQFNLPDTTGVKLYIDGDKGSTPTDYSGEGHTLTDNSESFSGNAWSFSSLSTSNVTMSTGDFAMEGTHPHSVSMWFNAANVSSNATLFRIGTAAGEGDAKTAISLTETGHLGWIDGGDNQFLVANTWHNLVYSTQGGGGLRTCYLDGRKLGDVSVQDTSGEYPPFAMTTYSELGYTVSASTDAYATTGFYPWKAFNDVQGNEGWHAGEYNNGSSWYTTYAANAGGAVYDTANWSRSIGGIDGEWLKLEMPHRLVVEYITLKCRTSQENGQAPKDFKIIGSNDDVNWDIVSTQTGVTASTTGETHVVSATKAYKYLAIVITRVQGTGNQFLSVGELSYHGHKENDTTRFPVSSTVQKYPHMVMTGYAQRGYVASASGENLALNPPRAAYTAFAEGGGSGMWDSGSATYQTTGNYDVNTNLDVTLFTLADGITQRRGHWIKLKFPRKILLSHYYQESTSFPLRRPDSVSLLGSDDDINWYIIKDTFSVPNQDENTISVNATTAYRYILYMVHSISGSEGRAIVNKLRYYGTEEDFDIVARVGEGLDGKVANFRVYDKYLHEEQALELWDAQKDQFGRATSSVSVYKGHVGIGTTTPEAALTVMDEAEEMEEFPPRAMTSADTYMEGHGVFRIIESSHNSSGQEGWRAFEDTWALSGTVNNSWLSKGGTYNADETPSSTAGNINGVFGEYLILESPYRVKMSYVLIYPRAHNSSTQSHSNPPKTGKIWGSNDLNESWTEIASYENLNFGTTRIENLYGQHPQRVNIHATRYYKYIAFQVTVSNHSGSSAQAYTNIQELRYFGTRERGQSTLHDGELKLTKNLTVPRIGPALNGGWASQTPRRDQLVVEYDTSTDLHNNKAIDSSGNEIHGTFTSGAYYNRDYGAFAFDGVNDYVSGTLNNPSGPWVHSVSCWYKPLSDTEGVVWAIGTNSSGKEIAINNANGTIKYFVYGCDSTSSPISTFTTNKWHHIVAVFRNSERTTAGEVLTGRDVYIDGLKQTMTAVNNQVALNLDANTTFRLANQYNSYYNHGLISNFKIYDVALGPGEVRKLYEMGRNGPGNYMNIVDTAVAIGRHTPQAQLDVSGKIRANGANTNFTGQHRCSSAQGPLEKGLVVSASKNTYRNITGGLSAGPKAITIDESLPVVSLSNVTQDKACFGVVSRMEEANTLTRSETTGGLISEASKVLGDNRVIVNSVGEGAIWVCDANGPLESGDYITTSNVAGYGQKQDGEFLANYTVAKITMDCDFTASNVAVQAIKKVETLKTVTEDVWEGLSDYDRSSNTETQYINESNVVLSVEEYESLAPEEQNTYSDTTIQTYYRIQRGENILDEHGMLQWEDTGATEPGYELRYLDASGQRTDEANCVHRAAFVGCTYHCG